MENKITTFPAAHNISAELMVLSWFFIGAINCAPTLLLFPPSPVTFLLIPLSPRVDTCNCYNIGIKLCKYKSFFNNKSWLIPSIRRKFLCVFTREVSVSMPSWVVVLCVTNSCRVCLSSQHRPGVVLTEVAEFFIAGKC